MGDNSAIGWTRGDDGKPGATWNPFRAQLFVKGDERGRGWYCEQCSAGCGHCYAEDMNDWRGNGLSYAPDQFRTHEPIPMIGGELEVWLEKIGDPDQRLRLFVDRKTLLDPIRWTRGRKIFPCSMTDYCLRFYPDTWLQLLYAVMILAKQHTFQILTKRSGRQRRFLEMMNQRGALKAAHDCIGLLAKMVPESEPYIRNASQETIWGQNHFPPVNAWIGVSIESQDVIWRAQDLMNTPAALRWWSLEPLIGRYSEMRSEARNILDLGGCNWMVPGGESGENARPSYLEDFEAIIQDGDHYGVPVFLKQTGARPFAGDPPAPYPVKNKGEDPSQWPESIRRQDFPKFV